MDNTVQLVNYDWYDVDSQNIEVDSRIAEESDRCDLPHQNQLEKSVQRIWCCYVVHNQKSTGEMGAEGAVEWVLLMVSFLGYSFS